jgi:ATP-binding cassette subfamily B protein
MGGLLIVMACLSLTCGGLGGYTCAKASAGFSKNLRKDIFEKVQDFSFENIDKFSSASLVTRLTTDASNVQMSFMMLIRTAIRSPLMLIFATVTSFVLGGPLAATFVVVIPVLVFGLLMISKKAMPAFRRVFKKYDKLNESIEENVRGMRVVKGFSREDYEKEKFGKASENIRMDFTKAERIIALNAPLMNFCMYFNMIFILLVGAYFSINSMFGVDIGHISAMLTYGVQILMSLMMLSMIYVMLTMSAESARRICEVLNEESTLTNPENPITEVKDGSITFKNANFKYSKEAQKYALYDINIDIADNEKVAFVGVDESGKTYVTPFCPEVREMLFAAGYEEGSLYVPLSNGEEILDPDLNAKWHAMCNKAKGQNPGSGPKF